VVNLNDNGVVSLDDNTMVSFDDNQVLSLMIFSIYALWESFKQVFENIKGLFGAVFSPIGEAIQAVKEGRWGDAAKAAWKLNPVATAQRTVQYIADGGLTKGVKDAYARGDAMGRKSFQDDHAEVAEVVPTVHDAAPVLDGKIIPQQGSGGGKQKSYGLDIVGGSGFSKSGSSSGGGGSTVGSFSSGGGGDTYHVTNNNNISNHFSGPFNSADIRKIAEDVLKLINAGINGNELAAR
jgi:uncharacterized membrane protein YgcG